MKKLACLIILFPLLGYSQRDWDAIEITNVPVKGNISFLLGSGGNIGVLTGEDGVLIVDDQFAELSEKISSKLMEMSDGGELKYILNTHYHGDHTGGNENLSENGATILAHENVKKRLSTPFLNADQETVDPKPEGFWPTETFKKVKKLTFNGEEIEIHHVPNGHTDGDVLVFFKTSNVIHAGDLFVRYGFPYIDMPAKGSIEGMIRAQNNIKKLADENTKIIPGHGDLATLDDVDEFLDMLTGARDKVASLKADGMSLDECLSERPLAEYHERWSGNFINTDFFTRVIYETLED